ncbi:suppressor of fused domain protein [Ewingella americana]|uniref:suppressor of fused domain protein n=1 Tax=Ewingella americana TaxID=41202 RepID=UPI0012ADA25A|nr:suppressor of fused domain protein [Ewingella americana]MRT05352.1 suppressor of fused domain protein [Ewingella americana]
MRQSDILVEVSNDKQTLTALVEQDDRVAYLYIYAREDLRDRFPRMRACWIRNLTPAPQHDDHAAMESGKAPMLAAQYCRNLEAEAPLDPAHIQILWNESDDGAALWYQGLLLAVIPGWSLYIDHSVCYSAGCIKQNPLTFPLGSASTNTQYELADKTRQFWRDWQQEDHNPWPKIQRKFLASYEERFGPSVKYYGIDQGNWPPMAISQHEDGENYYFFTLGMSIRPMPQIDIIFNDEAREHRRIELAFAVGKEYVTEENAVQMASALSGYAQLPWTTLSWLGEGHTLISPMAPLGYEGHVVSSALCSPSSKMTLPDSYGDPVNQFWISPIFTAEREFALSRPNGGYDLVAAMIEQGARHVFAPRSPVMG